MNGAYTSEVGKYFSEEYRCTERDVLPPPRKGDARYLETSPVRRLLRMRIEVVMVISESL